MKEPELTSCARTGRKRVVVATFDMTSVTLVMMMHTHRAMAGPGRLCRASSWWPIQALRPDSCRDR